MNLDLSKHRQLKGEQHPQAKLTEREVRLIRLYYKTGFKQKELAEMFDVSMSTIDAIVNRRSWRDVK